MIILSVFSMKKSFIGVIFIFLNCFSNLFCFAQASHYSSSPEFSGGNDEWIKIINKHAHIPDSVKNGLVRGNAFMTLKIDTNGVAKIQNVYGCFQCRQEILKLFKFLSNFKPAYVDGKKIEATYNLAVRFSADPDSLLIYKPENLYGSWRIQGDLKCQECPYITFNKDKTALLIGDTLIWSLNNRELILKDKNDPKRHQYFFNTKDYKVSFSEYFKVLSIENQKEIYKLYK